MAAPAPEGWHCVTPRIVVRPVAAMVEFLKHTFGARGEARGDAPAVMRIGDSNLMVSSTEARAATPAFLYVYVDDVDATFQRALASGAVSLEAPQRMPYGDRRAMVRDPFDNVFQIATRED